MKKEAETEVLLGMFMEQLDVDEEVANILARKDSKASKRLRMFPSRKWRRSRSSTRTWSRSCRRVLAMCC